MCVQYRGRCSVPWSVFSTLECVQYCEGYLDYYGDVLNTMGNVQYCGGYHDKRGRYLEHRRVVHYHEGYHENRGGYFEYSGGCSVLWEDMIHVGVS